MSADSILVTPVDEHGSLMLLCKKVSVHVDDDEGNFEFSVYELHWESSEVGSKTKPIVRQPLLSHLSDVASFL